MKRKYFCAFVIVVFTFVLGISFAKASEVAGHNYYTMTFDAGINALQAFTWSFGPADAVSDNATDNSTRGEVSISAQAKTFDNSTGAYVGRGNFFRGTWKAVEKNHSAFYEADIYTYYSFLFFGVVFVQSSCVTGIIYSDTIIKSTAKDTEEIKSFIPFVGILVEGSKKVLKVLSY
ncbi:MAG: hypothetical protein WCQ99_08555 [Pseudomonadota bacterium]